MIASEKELTHIHLFSYIYNQPAGTRLPHGTFVGYQYCYHNYYYVH